MIARRLARVGIALLVALLLLLSARGAEAADEALEVQRLVATFTARFDGAEQLGTAVVFALTPERIHLVTAAHVVRHNGRSPTAIELRFGGGDHVVRARIGQFDDKDLDIAVLIDERRDASSLDLDELPFDRLAAAGSAKRGDPVFVVGNRRNAPSVNVTPDRVSVVDGDRIRFESRFVVTGFSGGPLFNERWQLLGLVLGDDPPEAEALAFGAVAAKLKEWGLPLALRRPYTQLSAGDHVSCRIGADGAARCWGELDFAGLNSPEQLKYNNFPNQRIAIAGVRWRSISVGEDHLCGIDDAGAAWCLGQNDTGQLGNGSKLRSLTSPVRVAGGLAFSTVNAGRHSCGVAVDGAAWCWGEGMYGELGNDSNESSAVPVQVAGGLKFRSISAGLMHSCGLTTDRRAWCWGSNMYAYLGVGSEAGRTVRQPTAMKGTASLEAFVVGYEHSCALASDGSVWCGGQNEFGQIGDGSAIDRKVPVRVAGTRRFKQLTASASGRLPARSTQTARLTVGAATLMANSATAAPRTARNRSLSRAA